MHTSALGTRSRATAVVLLNAIVLALTLTIVAPATAWAELPPIIPRDVLFGNPERSAPQLSPDGKRLAWLAPDKNHVMQVWVRTVGKEDDRAVTADEKRPIRRYEWAQDDHTLLYQQDADGDENFHVFGVNLDDGNVRDLTPWLGVRADLLATNPDKQLRDQILVQANVRDRQTMDVYRVDLRTGAAVLDTQNPGDVQGWTIDDKLVVRGAQAITADGGTELRVRDSAKAKWKVLAAFGPEENVTMWDFSKDGRSILLATSIGSDTERVVWHDLKTKKEKEVAKHELVDVSDVLLHPTKHVVEAVAFDTGKVEWTIVDASVKEDFAGIAKLADGQLAVLSRDRDDKHWLVGFVVDRGPVRYYTWDRAARQGTFLFVNRPALEKLTLAEIQPIELKARDGLALHGYLTLPPGIPGKKLPLVLLVHGGPWGRDTWGWNPVVQLLANRGHAVLQVNFRASTGFGKKFLHAGDRQWGLAMHDDLLDAVKWAVDAGYADPKRVAIMGGSYGGYAALAGAAFTPDTFRAAVDIVGPSNLFTLLAAIPPYWKAFRAVLYARMGDPENEQDKALLRKASPLFSADKIKIPLLIGQGAHDPRVNQRESEQIVAAIEKKGGRVTYVLYPDEGHGFARPENNIDFQARVEAFLAETLGGRAEPLAGDKIAGSTAVVKVVGAKKKAR